MMPDLVLRPGMTLAARVAERSGRHGILLLAGRPLVADLPDEISPGDKLQLVVQQARADKVVLKLVPEQPLSPPAESTLTLAQPDGSQARVTVDEDGSGQKRDGSEHAAVALTYETPALGAVNLRLELVPGGVIAHAQLAAGRPFELADDAAEVLRGRLEAITGRSAEVRVSARHDPFDAYA